ncbi:hypothetical protein D3C80_1643210 [compost metagenome]
MTRLSFAVTALSATNCSAMRPTALTYLLILWAVSNWKPRFLTLGKVRGWSCLGRYRPNLQMQSRPNMLLWK